MDTRIKSFNCVVLFTMSVFLLDFHFNPFSTFPSCFSTNFIKKFMGSIVLNADKAEFGTTNVFAYKIKCCMCILVFVWC